MATRPAGGPPEGDPAGEVCGEGLDDLGGGDEPFSADTVADEAEHGEHEVGTFVLHVEVSVDLRRRDGVLVGQALERRTGPSAIS